jgi:hypothetical protein
MATPTTSTPPTLAIPLTTTISIKLDGSNNYLAWKMQFLNLLRGHDMIGFIDGSEACPPRNLSTGSLNPAYDVWQKKDVCLLGWILASISERLVSTIYGLTTSKQVWTTLQNRFSSQSRSRISHLKRQLQMLTQGGKTCSAYLDSAKTLVDQLAAAGKPVDDQDLINFLLIGLHNSYTPFVTSFNFASRDTEFTFEDFQTELLGFENLLEITQSTATSDNGHFAFASRKPKLPASIKKTKPFNPRPPQNNRSPTSPIQNTRSICQICDKPGHLAIDCFHRFDYSFQGRYPPQDLAAMVKILMSNMPIQCGTWTVVPMLISPLMHLNSLTNNLFVILILSLLAMVQVCKFKTLALHPFKSVPPVFISIKFFIVHKQHPILFLLINFA